MKMHVDMIGWHQNGENTKRQGNVVFITYGGFNAVLVTVGEAVRGNVYYRRALHHRQRPNFQYYYINLTSEINLITYLSDILT